MTNSIMNIGVSGLRTAQVALLTTGHNISNAATPGYNRQQAIQSSNAPVLRGNNFIGSGVHVDTVQRVYNQFLVNQSLQAQAQSSQLNSYYNEISQIDNLLADTASGLTPALHDFFNAVHDVASNPASIPSRQAMLSTAESLASRFQHMDQRLSEMYEGVNAQITSHVTEINSLTQQISRLNKDIQIAEGQANGQPINDLHDQRDTLVRDLSQLVHVDVVQQNNGHYNVFIGNGQPLVVGGTHMALKAVESPDDQQRLTIAMDLRDGDHILLPEHQLRGGSLGGLLNYRSGTLDNVQRSFDEIAFELANSFNAQHRMGVDLHGVGGEQFFQITEDSDQAARNITVTIKNLVHIAAAVPHVFTEVLDSNTGSATMSVSGVGALPSNGSVQEIIMTFTDDGEFEIEIDGEKLSKNVKYTPGEDVHFDGWSVQIEGDPKKDDVFTIEANITGVTDNRNALLLAGLQTDKTMYNGTTSFQSAYAQIVSEVGNKTRELEVTSKTQESLLAQVDQSIQSVSGVNLEEEAANLIRYQQLFQASSKVIEIGNSLFDSILRI